MTAPISHAEKVEEEASLVGAVAAETLSGAEVALLVLLVLVVCPPLAFVAFVVVAPLLVAALVIGLIAAVLTTPYLLVHHFRRHHADHASLFAHRVRHAGRALLDLLPHRIVSGAREADGRR